MIATKRFRYNALGTRLYPYLLGISFPLSMWLNNLSEDPSATNVVATFAITLLSVAVADGILRRLTGNAVNRSLLLALLIVGGFAYGHAFDLLNESVPVQHRLFAPLWLALLVSVAFAGRMLRRTAWPTRLSRILVTSIPMLLVAQITWAIPVLAAGGSVDEAVRPFGEVTEVTAKSLGADPSTPRPDVYYIILDGYARDDVLQELCGFDNRPFLNALRSRGFYVPPQARSNYSQTRLSLSSSLSMDYLPELPADESYDLHHRRIRRLRKESRVVARFRECGYRYRYVGSMYFPVDRAADEELFPTAADCGYFRAFLATTAVEPLLVSLRLESCFPGPVEITEYQLANIARAKEGAAPLFTFAHVACPHEPYVYDRHGPLEEPIPPAEATAADYVEQIRYLNRRVLELIDAIDRTSGRGAVVLLQADHGSDFGGMPETPNQAQLHERMAIFSAYRFPPRVQEHLYPTMTPVNAFRVLLAGLWGDDLPLLKDRSFYSSYETPFALTEAAPPNGSDRSAHASDQSTLDSVRPPG